MAMTLRIEDDDLEALRLQAEQENRSMQQVALIAIREYVARQRHEALVERIGRDVVTRDASLLRRLGEA